MKPKPKSILSPSIRAQIKDGLKGKRPWRGWDSCHSEEGRDGTELKRSSTGSRGRQGQLAGGERKKI